jgi:hypothetical protein
MSTPDTFAAWTTELARRGITVLPPSAAVPVELHAALPDGRAVHFRCRGTRVSLRVFAAEDVRLAVPARAGAPTELPLTTERWLPLGAAGAAPTRVVFTGQATATAAIEGGQRWGWRGYEAGLLRVREAALLFDELLGSVVPELAPLGV